MNVPNDTLLASYRKPGLCEYCRKPCSMRCAAHIFSKGAGRVDHPINLIQLGMDALRDCDCHSRSHHGRSPTRDDFLAIVAGREQTSAQRISDTIAAVRACPRKSTFEAASVWLREHFPRDVAEKAIEIIGVVYERAG